MSRLNIVFLIVFVGIFVWISLFQPNTVERIQRGAMSVFSPSMKASDKINGAIEAMGEEALSPTELRSRLDAAVRERDRLQLEVLQLDELKFENNELRRALQYVESSPLELVPARVISRKPSSWYNTIIIDKGTNSGIDVDNPVIVPVGEKAGLVGKVSEVRGDNTAVVLLLTDEICQVSAKLENTQEQGIINGQRGSLRSMPDLKLRYLSKEANATPGQRVITSGTGELFPANLLLGEVVELKTGTIDAEAVVKPSVNFDLLKDVFVILPDAIEKVVDPPKEESGES